MNDKVYVCLAFIDFTKEIWVIYVLSDFMHR